MVAVSLLVAVREMRLKDASVICAKYPTKEKTKYCENELPTKPFIGKFVHKRGSFSSLQIKLIFT